MQMLLKCHELQVTEAENICYKSTVQKGWHVTVFFPYWTYCTNVNTISITNEHEIHVRLDILGEYEGLYYALC